MVLLEQLQRSPRWMAALEVALTLPPGVPERRAGEDPWSPAPVSRPRRVTDDLAWLRRAVDEPAAAGLREVDEDPRIRVWEIDDYGVGAKLDRLLERGVLDAAGFMLHHEDLPQSGGVSPTRSGNRGRSSSGIVDHDAA